VDEEDFVLWCGVVCIIINGTFSGSYLQIFSSFFKGHHVYFKHFFVFVSKFRLSTWNDYKSHIVAFEHLA